MAKREGEKHDPVTNRVVANTPYGETWHTWRCFSTSLGVTDTRRKFSSGLPSFVIRGIRHDPVSECKATFLLRKSSLSRSRLGLGFSPAREIDARHKLGICVLQPHQRVARAVPQGFPNAAASGIAFP